MFWVSSLVGWLKGEPERRQTGSEHAARGGPVITDDLTDDSVAVLHMAEEAGGFKVNCPGWFRSGKILREMKDLGLLSARLSGVFAPAAPAGKLAKRAVLHII